ncbi:MAG: hypothetical protein H6701_00865 [Myxococcales bacterium]|nr:hypothetical protein [Myxococcales bacterium]
MAAVQPDLGKARVSDDLIDTPSGVGEKLYKVIEARQSPVRRAGYTVTLPRNALVRAYALHITAAPAGIGTVRALGKLTFEPAPGDARRKIAVVDFGLPLTVSRVELTGLGGIKIRTVYGWDGSRFSAFVFNGDTTDARFATQIRSERLRIEVERGETANFPTADAFASGCRIHYEDDPSDLELRIDDGAPFWSAPGPVVPEDRETISEGGFDASFTRRVDLTTALAALTGDPLAPDTPVAFEVTLTSRSAALLTLDPAPGGVDVARIRRVAFDGQPEVTLDFPAEGERTVPLALPPATTRRVEQVRFTAVGEAPPERVLPPVGPTLSDLAVLVLDPERAISARLATTDLDALTGLRLPLRAGPAGAELRIVLHAHGGGGPGDALPRGVSDPVELAPGPAVDAPIDAAALSWTTFTLPAPAPLTSSPPWATLVVARGEVVWPSPPPPPAPPPPASAAARPPAPGRRSPPPSPPAPRSTRSAPCSASSAPPKTTPSRCFGSGSSAPARASGSRPAPAASSAASRPT